MKWLRLIGVSLLVLTLFHVYEVNAIITDEWAIDGRWTVRDDLWRTYTPPPEDPPPVIPPDPLPDIPPGPVGEGLLTLAVNTRFLPNPNMLGGLNTEYLFVLLDHVNNISFTDHALRISKPGGAYWSNVTSGANSSLNMVFWFENVGGITETRFTPNKTLTFDFYVHNLGEPTQVYGASSWTFNNKTEIVNLVAPGNSEIRILWQFDPIGAYFFLGLGLGGFVFVGVGCFYSTRRLRNINTDDDILQVSWGLLVALVGVGLIIVWLWP